MPSNSTYAVTTDRFSPYPTRRHARLRDVTVDSHFEKTQGHTRVHVGTERNEPDRLIHPSQQSGRLDRSDTSEVGVENDHLRAPLLDQADRLFPVDRLADNVNVSSCFQQLLYQRPNQDLVLDEDDLD